MRLPPQQVRFLAAAVIAATALMAPTPSSALPPTGPNVQAQIDAHLAEHPGGKQINATEVSYANGAFVISFVRTGQSTDGPNCPRGWFCFYDHLNYGFPMGKLSSCGWQDLAWWGWNDRTESAYYNLPYGSVTFINHGAYPNHSDDDPIFSLNTSRRGLGDVAPYRNAADHVYRSC